MAGGRVCAQAAVPAESVVQELLRSATISEASHCGIQTRFDGAHRHMQDVADFSERMALHDTQPQGLTLSGREDGQQRGNDIWFWRRTSWRIAAGDFQQLRPVTLVNDAKCEAALICVATVAYPTEGSPTMTDVSLRVPPRLCWSNRRSSVRTYRRRQDASHLP